MVGSNRVALAFSAVFFTGACTEGTNIGSDGISFRTEEHNDPQLNSSQLQGPFLQGPFLQGVILNGPFLQGPFLQGPFLQGPFLQSPFLQGVTLNSPFLQGPFLQSPFLQGTLFTGVVVVDGQEIPVSGMDFVDSEWEIQVTTRIDGQDHVEGYILHFDDIWPSDEEDDVFLYDIKVRPKNGGEERPLCMDADLQAVPAIPLQNYWNLDTGDRVDAENVITFACTNAVLAKCTLWGYRPWATATRCDKKGKKCKDVSLRDYHQACTRMARADYCGDGHPWTVEGMSIDITDNLDPSVQTPTTDWFVEAEWNPDGAYCLNDIRLQELKDQGLYPECFSKKNGKPKTINDCGSLKNDRALMVSTFDKDEEDDECPGNGHGKGHGKGHGHGHGH